MWYRGPDAGRCFGSLLSAPHMCIMYTHTHTPRPSLRALNVSAGRSQTHSYRTRFDYVLIQSREAERAPLIFETQNDAYWAEKNMADSWTRLSPEGNIISVVEHVYGSHLPSLLNGKKKICQLLLCSQVISSHYCFVRQSVHSRSSAADTN